MAKRKMRQQKARQADFDERPEADWEPRPSLEAEWITEDLIARTRKVWSNYLGRDVPPEEATEILLNVHMIADTFRQAALEAAEESKREAEASKDADADPLAGWSPEI